MSTTTVVSDLPVRAAAPRREVLYPHAQWYFLAAIATTWLGFAHSYFMRLGTVTVFHHIHGATAGLWMALLIAEPILYQRGKLQVHRKLGRVGAFGLLPLLMVGGAIMIHSMAKVAAQYPGNSAYGLAFLDVCSLVMLPFFVVQAIRHGRDVQLHARWMACTVLVLLPPALARALFLFPAFHTLSGNANRAMVVVLGILVLLMVDDWRKGKIRAPYVTAFAIFAVVEGVWNFVAGWGPWMHVVAAYGRV